MTAGRARRRGGAGRRRRRPVAGPIAAIALAAAGVAVLSPAPAVADCVAAIEAEEARFALPEGLLMAVALTESGRGGRPWPWALNIAGTPAILPDAAAMRRAIAENGDGTGPNIDVGCMQISLAWHAERFADWRVLLEPAANVAYGAYLLRHLFERHGSWTLAVAHYHSGTLDRQRAYVCRVWRHLLAIGGAAAPDVAACAG